jgi:hypothetical protein
MGQFFMEQTKLAKEHELFHSMKSCLIVLSLQRYAQGRTIGEDYCGAFPTNTVSRSKYS